MLLNIARTLPRSAVNGPGERFVIWVQGCSLHCPHCWNADTWSRVSPLQLAEEILATADVEGITLTGGEPFEQAEDLCALAESVRRAGRSVMAYTGYALDELRSGAQRSLLARCDVVVAGPYIHARRSLDLAWRGSSNQTVHFLTARYNPADMPSEARCEAYVGEGGAVTFTGFPPAAFID